jgi:hypothetical protein
MVERYAQGINQRQMARSAILKWEQSITHRNALGTSEG